MHHMAKVRINPERTCVEFITPEGESFTSNAVNELTVLTDSDDERAPKYLGVAGEFDGLKSNTIYKLVEVRTDFEEDADIEEADDEDDEDEDEDEDENEDEVEEIEA